VVIRTRRYGNYRKITVVLFGEDSKQVKFLDDKIKSSPHGSEEKVIADERQVLHMLASLQTLGENNED
jgi:hypothetical protein